MNEDKTVIMRKDGQTSAAGLIRVSVINEKQTRVMEFANEVIIGRHLSCNIVIEEEGVSRQHLKLYPASENWVAEDMDSANGVFHQNQHRDQQIKSLQLHKKTTLTLGPNGAEILLEPVAEKSETAIADKNQGEHTRLIHTLVKKQQKKHLLRTTLLALISGIIIAALVTVIVQQKQTIGESKSIAVDLFYDMKALEVTLARTEVQVRKSGSISAIADVRKRRKELSAMKQRYQSYLDEISVSNKTQMTKEDVILKVAGDFGESELELPEGFIEEVLLYVDKWKSSNRLKNVLSRIDREGRKQIVLDTLRDYGLPEQFMYLPLQESNYQLRAIGPETYAGIAKGAWQFIPSTATEYGLKIGPLAAVREYDPEDERFEFESATAAAVKYLYDIYSTEAQASGLLVMASYNWGHNKVRKLVKKMPPNPRDRNFWKLIQNNKLPEETYDYVFRIFSAAVIGENPKLFGFDFEKPIS